MKRYTPVMSAERGRDGEVFDTVEMEERPDGDYIRHDDADLAALVEAATAVCAAFTEEDGPHIDENQDMRLQDLRDVLSALAASGTTTRGGGEA